MRWMEQNKIKQMLTYSQIVSQIADVTIAIIRSSDFDF